MSEGVRSFAIDGGTAHLLGTAADMRAASRALPDGAYTTLRTYEGRRLLRLGQHLRRLEESAALQGHPGRVDEPAVRRGLREILGKTAGGELRLRLTFAPPRFFVSVEAFVPLPPAAYEAGVDCVTVAVHRENPHAKDTRFIATAGQAYAALPEGAEEGLMLAADGSVLEGLSSNFFAVADGVLRTEGDRVLAGVTRAIVLEVAQGVLPVALRPVTGDAARHRRGVLHHQRIARGGGGGAHRWASGGRRSPRPDHAPHRLPLRAAGGGGGEGALSSSDHSRGRSSLGANDPAAGGREGLTALGERKTECLSNGPGYSSANFPWPSHTRIVKGKRSLAASLRWSSSQMFSTEG